MGIAVLQLLKDRRREGQSTLAVLVDPDKFDLERVEKFIGGLPEEAKLLLVGGSEVSKGKTSELVQAFKRHTSVPVVLFPGDVDQLCEGVDALLFLSLLSGENPEYLIRQQIRAAAWLRSRKLEVIPVGYILIDGGHRSAVQRVSQTEPLSRNDTDRIVETAYAGQLMGKELIYLEAGSGAVEPVPLELIRAVREQLAIPLVVGGGIRSAARMKAAFAAGADMVVMGNVFEK